MDVTADLLLRLSKPGPRYTSYPTAPEWKDDFPEAEYDAALAEVRQPASVYVHIPFCVAQCTYCGCNMVVSGRREPGVRYLDDLEKRLSKLNLPGATIDVARIHLGGGTPTWLLPSELERLYGILYTRFKPIEGAEISVEADPEVTTDEHVDAMAAMGVNRLSMGVQSFDPKVLEAVNRPQEHTRVHAIMDRARALGMHSMNLDLMYGLPFQTPSSFEDTLEKTLVMRPDRLAVFGYAHVPWLKSHMKRIPADALANPVQRIELFLLAHRMLTERGYQFIGFDHFALPDDDLATAQREERLHRNFMGYTTMPDVELVGLGMSAISELDGLYAQEKTKLSQWWKAVESDGPMLEKGFRLSDEDRLRRDVINRMLCNFVIPIPAIEEQYGLRFGEHFADSIEALLTFEAEGLVQVGSEEIRVTEPGRLLVRNLAMTLDPYLRKPTEGPRFSQTV